MYLKLCIVFIHRLINITIVEIDRKIIKKSNCVEKKLMMLIINVNDVLGRFFRFCNCLT